MRTALFRWIGQTVSLASFAGALIALPAQAGDLTIQPAALPGGYAMNLPGQLRQIPNESALAHTPNVAACTFGGWPNGGHDRAYLLFCVAQLKSVPNRRFPTLDETTSFYLQDELLPHIQGMVVDSRAMVKMAGTTFERIGYHGHKISDGLAANGFIYLALTSNHRLVTMRGEDEEPYSSQILPALNAAALTLTQTSDVAATVVHGRDYSAAKAPASMPVWNISGGAAKPFTADADAAAQLARARTLVCGGEYSMRLPCGYVPYEVPSAPVAPGRHMSAFRSMNPNSTHPVLVVCTAEVSQSARTPQAVSEMISGALSGVGTKMKLISRKYRQYPVERGSLIDVPFYRLQFTDETATENTAGTLTNHGFAYIGYDHGTMVCILAENFVPYSERTLPLQEASALSLTRRPQW